MELVRAQLKDPDSAKFKGVKESSPGYVCGFVNAKNSYGGYIGYRVFYWHNGSVSLNDGDMLVDMSDPKLC